MKDDTARDKNVSKKLRPARLMEVDDSHMGRFPLPQSGAEGRSDSYWRPGMIEVEFTHALRPEYLVASSIVSDVVAPLLKEVAPVVKDATAALQGIFKKHSLVRAEPAFRTAHFGLHSNLASWILELAGEPGRDRFVHYYFPDNADVVLIARELNQLLHVESAVPVPRIAPPALPNEPLEGIGDQVVLDLSTGFENQWYIHRCRAHLAWPHATGAGVILADIDFGFRVSHQDLISRIEVTHNSMNGSDVVTQGDDVSHGTATLGLAGAADNGAGMIGFAFGAALWGIQADDGSGKQFPQSWVRAIDHVRCRKDIAGRRKVIILEVQTKSGGNIEMMPTVRDAIKRAIAAKIIVCVAAGNGDRDVGIDDAGTPIPPTGSIAVGATQFHPTENRRALFSGGLGSNWGNRIVVSAPGDEGHDITCSDLDDDAYRNKFGGTSGATPKVAGTVALMLEVNPDLSPEAVSEILGSGTAVISEASKPAGAFLNAVAAVEEALRRKNGNA